MGVGALQGVGCGVVTNRHCLPELLGIVMRAGGWEGLVVIKIQIGFHEAGSIVRTEDEDVHEKQHLQN